MYVWMRLLRVAATHKSRGVYRLGDESKLSFRCLPTDIDMNIHLNNARYMMLADMGRIDIFLRKWGFFRVFYRDPYSRSATRFKRERERLQKRLGIVDS